MGDQCRVVRVDPSSWIVAPPSPGAAKPWADAPKPAGDPNQSISTNGRGSWLTVFLIAALARTRPGSSLSER